MRWLCAALLIVVPLLPAFAQPIVIDDCDDAARWKVVTSEAVDLRLSNSDDGGQTVGAPSRSLRLDFRFNRGAGYAIARLERPIDLPENFRLSFKLRAERLDAQGLTVDAPRNNLEIKLLDSLGAASAANVWWVNNRALEFPRQSREIAFKRRHFSHAWGPDAAKGLKHIEAIEFAVVAGAGQSGSIWIDDLRLEALDPVKPYAGTPTIKADGGTLPSNSVTLNQSGHVAWTADPVDDDSSLTVDFGTQREFGGLILEWASPADGEPGIKLAAIRDYDIDLSLDGQAWSTVAKIRDSRGGGDHIRLPEVQCRALRVRMVGTTRSRSAPGDVVATGDGAQGQADLVRLDRLRIMPVEFGTNTNAMLEQIASESPRGRWPRYFLKQASYWTVLGVDGDTREALMNHDGSIETGREQFSLEPFLIVDQRLITWADAKVSHSLLDGYLPIATVTWQTPGVRLDIQAVVVGEVGRSVLLSRYAVTAASAPEDDEPASRPRDPNNRTPHCSLAIAVRPIQVNPSYQHLNTSAGFAPIRSLAWTADRFTINETRAVLPLNTPARVGTTTLIAGDITEWLARDQAPPAQTAASPEGLCSGAMFFEGPTEPGRTTEYWIAVPLHEGTEPAELGLRPGISVARSARMLFDQTAVAWRDSVNRVSMTPPAAIAHLWDVVRSNLAYILINRDGPAIQPGSRSYERTWIRDGSLTSTALLAFGHHEPVRAFLDWFGPMQFESGKVPCCADSRGPDPVPEHDSHGQFIYAVLKYYLFTGDRAFLEGQYDRVLNAVRYIEFLRDQRTTGDYADTNGPLAAYHGLVPESISHEGYSAKPMHSYWDDLFVLKGLKDATTIAEILGRETDAMRLADLRDDFRASLYRSMRLAMMHHGIDYIPGCVELGDFDATSTTIGIFPVGELGQLPEPQLTNTFERYWTFFVDRRAEKPAADGKVWEGYTPYEARTIGSLIRLGQRERALAVTDFLVGHQRPSEWNAFAEVVYRNREHPGFIGDMPHTWCGSDFINSFRSMFVYEREDDRSLILVHGVLREWLQHPSGFSLEAWPTMYGPVSVKASRAPDGAVDIEVHAAPGGYGEAATQLVLMLPEAGAITQATVDGAAAALGKDGSLTLPPTGGKVRITYRDSVPSQTP